MKMKKPALAKTIEKMTDNQKLIAFAYLHGMADETIDKDFLDRFKEAIKEGTRK